MVRHAGVSAPGGMLVQVVQSRDQSVHGWRYYSQVVVGRVPIQRAVGNVEVGRREGSEGVGSWFAHEGKVWEACTTLRT